VILVTRLNGPEFAINPDLIERADATPDTVLTLVDGTKYVVAEPLREVMARIRDFRGAVIATAHEFETAGTPERRDSERVAPHVTGNVVALPTREA
jgi:flagellar protein FlbD